MQIERIVKEVVIRLPATIDTDDLQDFLDYIRYKDLTTNFKIAQKEFDRLANKVNKDWWTKNRMRFIK